MSNYLKQRNLDENHFWDMMENDFTIKELKIIKKFLYLRADFSKAVGLNEACPRVKDAIALIERSHIWYLRDRTNFAIDYKENPPPEYED